MDRLIIQGTPAEVEATINLIKKAFPNATLAEVLKALSK